MNNPLSSKLLAKSQEAFIVGIELYNKPTIHYRVEGFSFFICNAWELLLKARLLETEGHASIYYKNHPDRTLSLEACIRKVFTNNKDPLRQNLEKIIELRNTSTHFITEEYEQIYVPLFQSCVLNYINKLLEFFDIDITMQLGSNFLTLSVKIDNLDKDVIKARYPKEIANRIIKAMETVARSVGTLNSERYAIPVRHDFYLTKKKQEATACFSIARDAKDATFIMKELHDMQQECPYRMKDCLRIINEKIIKEQINFVNPMTHDENKRHIFNSAIFNLFVKFYGLKSDETYCYVYSRNASPTYSYSAKTIDLIIEQIKKDPGHIVQSLKSKTGKPTPGAKDSKP